MRYVYVVFTDDGDMLGVYSTKKLAERHILDHTMQKEGLVDLKSKISYSMVTVETEGVTWGHVIKLESKKTIFHTIQRAEFYEN